MSQKLTLVPPVDEPLTVAGGTPRNVEPESLGVNSAGEAIVAENTAGVIYTATAGGANVTPTFTLGGTDAALFAINSATGQVNFNSPPDFEIPRDNGVYDITVNASDGTNRTSQAVAITVVDVNEAPSALALTGTATCLAENTNTTGRIQIRDGDEVGGCSEASGGALGLLQQAVHRLHVGIAAVARHAAHDPIDALLEGVGQLLERLQPTAPGPADPAQHIRVCLHTAVFLSCFGVNRTQGHSCLSEHLSSAAAWRTGNSWHSEKIARGQGDGNGPSFFK